MTNEKILEKIRKLFELSKNNPSEEEAKSAACRAQELMVKYGIEVAEVEDDCKQEEIEEIELSIPAKKWKYQLARIVADNFRCKHFYCGRDTLVFYGHSTDVNIAAETFAYLFDMGNKLGNRLVREAKQAKGYADNVYNSCVVGFCEGIKEALVEQSKALMVVVPEDVKEQYKERSKDFGTMRTRAVQAYNGEAYRTGKSAGYNAMRRNALEG